MLGEALSDPCQVEAGGSMRGMGLLPMDTVFARQKTRTRVEGEFRNLTGEWAPLSGIGLEGYEIHMGETVLKGEAQPAAFIRDRVTDTKKADGAFAAMYAEPTCMESSTEKRR